MQKFESHEACVSPKHSVIQTEWEPLQVIGAGFAICKGTCRLSGMQEQGEVFKGEIMYPWSLLVPSSREPGN